MLSRLLTLAFALYGVTAMPQSKRQDDPNCIANIPAEPDADTVNKVYLAGVAKNVNMVVMRATFETCMQETRCHNLDCGDQDSVGAFQQRPSMGWGTPEQCMDVTYATNSFLNQAVPLSAANPGWTPDQVAQGVQRAALGNLYAQHFDTANRLIQQAADRTGVSWNGINPSGGGSNPPPSGGGGGGGCQKYTVVPGDYCYLIAQRFGIDVGAFMSWNPSINSGCTNLQPGTAYCITRP